MRFKRNKPIVPHYIHSLMFSCWTATLIASAIIVPRSYYIANAHSESYDDRYHVSRGLAFWSKTIVEKRLTLNDPPVGEAIIAFPIYLIDWFRGGSLTENSGHNPSMKIETIAKVLAVWKSILFCPVVGLAFCWCRQLYGISAAWVTAMLLTFEPNVAAHIAIPALDVMGAEVVVFACHTGWKFSQSPSRPRAIRLGAVTALGLLVKHTVVILPLVILIFIMLNWLVKPQTLLSEEIPVPSPTAERMRMLGLTLISGLFFLWAFLLFDSNRSRGFLPFMSDWPA